MNHFTNFAESAAYVNSLQTVESAFVVQRLAERPDYSIKFGNAEPDFPTPEHVVNAAVDAIKQGYTHYTSPKGIEELRIAIADYYSERQLLTDKDDIVIFPGSKFGLFSALYLLIDRNSEVIIQDPIYSAYSSIVKMLQGKTVTVPMVDDYDSDSIVESMAFKINQKTKAIIVNSPGHPTGAILRRRYLETLLELCNKRNIFLIIDTNNSSFCYIDESECFPHSDLRTDNLVIVSGFSKDFAMTGWRLGYTLAPKQFTDYLVSVQENSSACPASFVQKAAIAALTGSRDWQRRLVHEYQSRRDVMIREISKISGWTCHPPDGAFCCFPRINNVNSRAFSRALLEEKYVSTVPGSQFGESGEGHLRLAFTTPIPKIREGMGRIREFAN
ncbi:MAG: pyridoxal phosphate-dependent aminotransferase [Nitrososphaerales archaeon]